MFSTFSSSLRVHARRFAVSLSVLALASAAAAGQAAAQRVVNIKPIKICSDAGSGCANDGEMLFLAETNKIWAQAGISFVYADFTTLNATDFQNFETQAEVDAFFALAPGGAANPQTITMWFAGSIFDAFGEVDMVGGNRMLIDEVIFSINRIDTIAHELGHALGLQHDDPGVDVDYLMRSGDDRVTPSTIGDIFPDGAALSKLTAAQIATAQADRKVLAAVVPEPSTWAMLLVGFGVTGAVALRRRTRPAGAAPAAC